MVRSPLAPLIFALILSLGVTFASTASAEVTLLAEWLINGTGVTTLTLVEGIGEILLSDTANGSDILCSAIGVGSVGPDGEGEVTEMLTLTDVQISLSAPGLCSADSTCESSTTDVEGFPEKFPWHGILYLSEAGLYLTTLIQGESEYVISCLVLGIKITDECHTEKSTFEVHNVTGGVEAKEESGTPLATCSIGGAGTGELVPLAGNLLTSPSGTVTVSE